MARIKIPNTALGLFIKAAYSWLNRTVDSKQGLEVRFANTEAKLHVSVGADANYIEALIPVKEGDLDALSQPIFLDVPSLAAYKFDTEGLTMVVPQAEKEDQRITFSVSGFNFRIPRKKGDIWKRNFFDLKSESINGLLLDKETFLKLKKHIELPNSFRTDRVDFQICFDVDPGMGFICHAYDGMGAFCHTFRNPEIQGLEGRMVFIDNFFTPCKDLKAEEGVRLGMNDKQCFGEFKAEELGIETLRWTQPRYQKSVSEIPQTINNKRKDTIARLVVDPKEMKANINKSCMFLTPQEMRAIPIHFDVVSNQYAMLTNKPNGEGEVRADGTLKEAPASNLELNIQAACWKDYLSQFDDSHEVAMEVLQRTVVLVQSVEGSEFIYWMPVMPRGS